MSQNLSIINNLQEISKNALIAKHQQHMRMLKKCYATQDEQE